MKNWVGLILIITMAYCTTTPTPKRGAIIILQGTSLSGKTAIIQELQKIDSRYCSCDIDSFMKDFLIKNPISFTDRDYNMQLFTELFTSFFQTIEEYVDAGNTVLCDSVDTLFTEKLYHTFINTQIITVLVYLPLDIIQQRVNKHNLSCPPQQNKKNSLMTARQFVELYRQQNYINELVIDTATADTLKKTLAEIITTYSTFLINNSEQTDLLISYAQKIYSRATATFSLNTNDKVNIVAKIPYDFMVNNGTCSQQENAHLINRYITNL